ncbi:MAG: 50S ribosomal protein L16 [Bacteroidetes bacterium]|nr:50S ribosomal protein L16 [Bacteroidota bacterium]
MLQPKKTKHRKAHKGRIKGNAQRGATISFGSFALKALEPKWITNRQIEAARQAMTRHMKREGNVWIRIFPDKPITRKPQEVRMGKGKGNLEFWAAVVKPGLIMFEMDGVPEKVAREAMELAAQKLPIKTKFITRRDYVAEVAAK